MVIIAIICRGTDFHKYLHGLRLLPPCKWKFKSFFLTANKAFQQKFITSFSVVLLRQHCLSYQATQKAKEGWHRTRQNGRHIVDDIFKLIFFNEMFVFWFQFLWNLLPGAKLTTNRHYVADKDMAPNRRQAIICTNGGLVYWHIYAPLGQEELSSLWHQHSYFMRIVPFPEFPPQWKMWPDLNVFCTWLIPPNHVTYL